MVDDESVSDAVTTSCCIVGGGPAGMMLGFLLARAGIDVVVLEKHADFLRDFRGDTIHPSTLELLYELGLLNEFLKRPHQEARQVHGVVGGDEFVFADFTHLPAHCGFIAFMPQWEFLNFMSDRAQRLPTFRLKMQSEVTDLIEQDGRIVGVQAKTPTGQLQVHAHLTVGCDGRHSVVRERAGLKVEDLGAPIDVLWMRIRREPDDPKQPIGRFGRGAVFVMLDRGDYWQCAYVIRKGGYDTIRSEGLDAFHRRVAEIAPFLKDRAGELDDWEQVKLLTVMVDRLKIWHRAGLLCIGDAAHAMSPVGGVGINLAIQDAVAAANLLADTLRSHRISTDALAKVQKRRKFPTRWTQRLQLVIHHRVLERVLGNNEVPRLPWYAKLLLKVPLTRRIPALVIGIGFRPEHVQILDAFASHR